MHLCVMPASCARLVPVSDTCELCCLISVNGCRSTAMEWLCNSAVAGGRFQPTVGDATVLVTG